MLSRVISHDTQASSGERKAVVPPGHTQRLAELGGTRAEVAVSDARASAPPPHRCQSLERLERADQNCGGEPRALPHPVSAPRHPLSEKKVPGAPAPQQAGVASRAAGAGSG